MKNVPEPLSYIFIYLMLQKVVECIADGTVGRNIEY